jgi:hypothetical protein
VLIGDSGNRGHGEMSGRSSGRDGVSSELLAWQRLCGQCGGLANGTECRDACFDLSARAHRARYLDLASIESISTVMARGRDFRMLRWYLKQVPRHLLAGRSYVKYILVATWRLQSSPYVFAQGRHPLRTRVAS